MSQKKIDIIYILFIICCFLISPLFLFLILISLGFTGIEELQWVGAVILWIIGGIGIVCLYDPLKKRFADEKDS